MTGEEGVLRILAEIPYATTLSCGDMAQRAASPGAARAVGRVMAANPFPGVIPCHRVLGSGGRMDGYSGASGVAGKEWLLRFEAQQVGAGTPSELLFRETSDATGGCNDRCAKQK